MRADAERNRTKVLEAAVTAFAAEGLSVPVAEIARRAGVGTGTVSRHFPTKEALYRAIVLSRVEELVAQARTLIEQGPPERAFFEFFAYLVDQAAANRGLGEALGGAGFDIEAAAADLGLETLERRLLDLAQRAGAVRADTTHEDVKALLLGCLARERQPPDLAARRRMIDISLRGLAPDEPHRPSPGA
jgi:AcrR family transcriptional regulator